MGTERDLTTGELQHRITKYMGTSTMDWAELPWEQVAAEAVRLCVEDARYDTARTIAGQCDPTELARALDLSPEAQIEMVEAWGWEQVGSITDDYHVALYEDDDTARPIFAPPIQGGSDAE